MGLPSDLSDPNFIYLQRLLKMNPREAWGVLDWLWIHLNVSRDPTFKSAEHLAAILYWPGPAKPLAKNLVKAGYLKPHRRGGYIIADHERRYFSWVKQAIQRDAAATSTNLDRTLEKSRKKVATDPDPGSSPPKSNVVNFDHDPRARANRDRPDKAAPGGGKSPKNPREAARTLVQAAIQGVAGVGVRQSRNSAPPPSQPIGSYTARECALAAASYDRGNDHDTAVSMFLVRAHEMSQYSGGLDYFRDLLAALHNAANPQLRKGTGTIHNPGAFLNRKTTEWLEERKAS